MEDLAGVKNSNSFRMLKGSINDKLVNRIDDLPNCLILHPAIFLDNVYPSAVDAASLAADVITASLRSNKREPSQNPDLLSLVRLARLLEFLWCVENNLLGPISTEDLPDSEEVHQQCNGIMNTLLDLNWNLNLAAIQKEHWESTKWNPNHEDDQGKGPTCTAQVPQIFTDIPEGYSSNFESRDLDRESKHGKLSSLYPKPKKGKPKDPCSYNYLVDEEGSGVGRYSPTISRNPLRILWFNV
jgi:hypothetical protein